MYIVVNKKSPRVQRYFYGNKQTEVTDQDSQTGTSGSVKSAPSRISAPFRVSIPSVSSKRMIPPPNTISASGNQGFEQRDVSLINDFRNARGKVAIATQSCSSADAILGKCIGEIETNLRLEIGIQDLQRVNNDIQSQVEKLKMASSTQGINDLSGLINKTQAIEIKNKSLQKSLQDAHDTESAKASKSYDELFNLRKRRDGTATPVDESAVRRHVATVNSLDAALKSTKSRVNELEAIRINLMENVSNARFEREEMNSATADLNKSYGQLLQKGGSDSISHCMTSIANEKKLLQKIEQLQDTRDDLLIKVQQRRLSAMSGGAIMQVPLRKYKVKQQNTRSPRSFAFMRGGDVKSVGINVEPLVTHSDIVKYQSDPASFVLKHFDELKSKLDGILIVRDRVKDQLIKLENELKLKDTEKEGELSDLTALFEKQLALLQKEKENVEMQLKECMSRMTHAETSQNLVEDCKVKLASINDEKVKMLERIDTLNNEVESLKAKSGTSESSVAAIAAEKADLVEQIRRLEQDRNRITSNFDKHVVDASAHHAAELKAYETHIAKLEEQVSALRKENDDAKVQFEMMRTRKDTIDAQYNALQKQMELLEEKLKTESGEKTALRESYEKTQLQLAELQGQLGQTTNAKSAETQQLTQKLATISNEYTAIQKAYDDLLKTQGASREECNALVETLRKDLEAQRSGYATLKTTYDTLQALQGASRLECESIASGLRNELQTIKNEFAENKNAYESLKLSSGTGRVEKEQELEKLKSELLAEKERYDKTRLSYNTVMETLDMSRKEFEDTLETLRKSLENEQGTAQSRIDTAVTSAVEKTRAEWAERLRIAEEASASSKPTVATITPINEEIQKQFENQVTQLRTQNENLQGQIASLLTKLASLEENRTTANVELDNICIDLRDKIANVSKYIGKKLFVIDRIDKIVKNSNDTETTGQWSQIRNNNVDVINLANTIISNLPSPDAGCEQVRKVYEGALSVQEQLLSFDAQLTNLYEDVSGAVRIYVKFRPIVETGTVQKVGRFVDFSGSSCSIADKRFGPFFGVMNGAFTNADVYNGCTDTKFKSTLEIDGEKCCTVATAEGDEPAGVCRVFEQMSSGYHVVLFGYGTSGSGKTFTLLGKDTSNIPGLAHLAIANSGAEVSVRSIYELTYQRVNVTVENGMEGRYVKLYAPISGDIHGLGEGRAIDESPLLINALASSNLLVKGKQGSTLIKNSLTATDVFTLTRAINTVRERAGRIKATQNNPDSSRSHLFITFSFKYPNGKTGFLTIVDMGGVESPFDILNQFYVKTGGARSDWKIYTPSFLMDKGILPDTLFQRRVFTVNDPEIAWYDVDKRQDFVNKLNSYSTEQIKDIVKEGLFINESINHLVYYFKKKNYGIAEAMKMQVNKWSGGLKDYDPSKFFSSMPEKPNGIKIGMFNLLNELSTYKKTKSKFVMMCLVRGETIPKYCENSFNTLLFADSIKSS